MTFPTTISFGASLAHEAYLQIRERILRGQIPMGGVISRRQLAKELGMSFVPVTEAVQRLESEGLVESKPRVGTRVRIPTPSDIRERYIIREALETQSARLFCERASQSERRGLLDMAHRLDKEAEQVSADPTAQYAFQSFHLQFHMQIAHWAGSTLLTEMLEKNQLLVFNWLFDINAQSTMPAGWHAELAEVLTGHDPDAANLAMGNHIRSGMSDIQEAIARRFSSSLLPIGRMARNISTPITESTKTLKQATGRPRKKVPLRKSGLLKR
jgi:DNA-binding GntR family transcriptional regulator